MAVSMTLAAVRAHQKTVTRRHANTWADLKPGDELTLIEKGMGLPKGAKQVVVAQVEIVSNRVEPLYDITDDDVIAEGFDYSPSDFIDFWCESHGITFKDQGEAMAYEVRRIEWRYLGAPIVPALSAEQADAAWRALWPKGAAPVDGPLLPETSR